MRILLLVQDTGKLYGAERATLDLALGLHRAGESVRIVLMKELRLGSSPSAFREAVESSGLSCESIPVGHRFSWALVSELGERMVRWSVDVLHSTGYKADLHALLAARRSRRVALVSTVHGWLFRNDLREQCYARLNLWSLRRFDAVIALTRYYENYLASAGLRPDRLHRIPSGMDPDLFAGIAQPPSGTPFTVGIAGRFSEEKNHALFLEAAAQVRSAGTNIRFLMAGDGPLRATLEQMRDQLGLRDAVEMPGILPREEFLRRVHAVALTSRIENLPYSLMEAMAAGRPVIATRVGGIPDLVEDGVSGSLVSAVNASALARVMLDMVQQPDRYRAQAIDGLRRLRESFSLSHMIRAHQALYAEISTRC